MTKSELIQQLADLSPNIPRKDMELVVNVIFDSMRDALVSGERIEIRGFGSFSVKQRDAREGRNPKTGEIVKVEPKQTVDAYLNIESDTQWLNTHRDRKVRLNTLRYQAIEGAVEFKLEGYDASGERVPGAEDVVKLYLDNHASTGAIASITYGSQTFDECALIELPAANSPLTIKLRVDDPEGFLSSYALSVYHGSNDFTPTHDAATGQPVAASYQSVAPFRFYGTTLSAGADGHVEVNLIPVSGSWLPPGRSFCAFSFNLSSVDRTTDGKSTPGGRTLWRELIGISHPPS